MTCVTDYEELKDEPVPLNQPKVNPHELAMTRRVSRLEETVAGIQKRLLQKAADIDTLRSSPKGIATEESVSTSRCKDTLDLFDDNGTCANTHRDSRPSEASGADSLTLPITPQASLDPAIGVFDIKEEKQNEQERMIAETLILTSRTSESTLRVLEQMNSSLECLTNQIKTLEMRVPPVKGRNKGKNITNNLTDKNQQAKVAKKLDTNMGFPSKWALSAKKYWEGKGRTDLVADEEWIKFNNHYIANGGKAISWEHKWRTWYANAIQFNRAPYKGNGSTTVEPARPDVGDSVDGTQL